MSDTATPTINDTRKKLREIYSFTFEKEEKVKKTETSKVKNQETGEEEEVSVTKEVVEANSLSTHNEAANSQTDRRCRVGV